MHIKRTATILELENKSLGVTLQKQMRTGASVRSPINSWHFSYGQASIRITKFNNFKEQSGLDRPKLFSNYNFNSSSNF